MGIREELKDDYVDKYGFITPSKHSKPSQNGLLFTSEYYWLLWKLKLLKDQDKTNYLNLINQCKVEPGLYSRRPGDTSYEGPDDYIGLMVASKVMGLSVAKEILNYGKAHKYSWNTKEPGKWHLGSFFGRQFGFMCILYLCAGIAPSYFLRLCFYLSTVWTCRSEKSDTSNRLLSDLMMSVLDDHKLSKLTKAYWEKSVKKIYGEEGITGAVKIYFEKDHPFTRYWK